MPKNIIQSDKNGKEKHKKTIVKQQRMFWVVK
jgi:hypothetical protein